MILSLVEWLVEHILMEATTTSLIETPTEKEESDECTIVMQLDHIRSRIIYVKTLNQWFRELDLRGVLIFYRRWIFLMVCGKRRSLQVR